VTEALDPDQATLLLARMNAGDSGAAEDLLRGLYGELRRIAEHHMSDQRDSHTLQATALVNEAVLRLFRGTDVQWESRAHFLRTAATAMRHVLVDHARAKRAGKRGGGAGALPLDEALDFFEESTPDLLALDEALEELGQMDEKLLRIVELRFFGGLTAAEAGEVLGVTSRTVERGWATARTWLRQKLGE
jgi:RNA polymerase sigma factor (TIGR02999 family)